jgi:hypothetical protein
MIRTFCALFCLLALVVAAHADTLMLAPKYDVAGTNPNGSKYAGTATIEVISDTTFAIRWEIGSSVFKGFGMRMNDSVAATYVIGGDPGLIIYKVDDSGVLSGLWSVRGHNGSGTERLTPQK